MAQGRNQSENQETQQQAADGGFSQIFAWIVAAALVAIVAAALLGVF